jgi:hypothetical protein
MCDTIYCVMTNKEHSDSEARVNVLSIDVYETVKSIEQAQFTSICVLLFNVDVKNRDPIKSKIDLCSLVNHSAGFFFK